MVPVIVPYPVDIRPTTTVMIREFQSVRQMVAACVTTPFLEMRGALGSAELRVKFSLTSMNIDYPNFGGSKNFSKKINRKFLFDFCSTLC